MAGDHPHPGGQYSAGLRHCAEDIRRISMKHFGTSTAKEGHRLSRGLLSCWICDWKLGFAYICRKPPISTMHTALSRRLPAQCLRRCFSTSAPRLEIRDVGALSQRLIPKYRGSYIRPENYLLMLNFERLSRKSRGASFFTMASTAAECSSGAEGLCTSSYRLTG